MPIFEFYLRKMNHTLTEENYLKAIYKLSLDEKQKITPTAIASSIEVNAASVIDMLKKLTDKDLITYEKKIGANLTEKGSRAAANVLRKHRLWEVFLFEKLKYSWDEIHEMAEQLEHVQDDNLADRLDEFLGFPQFDPHGDPIPKANGSIQQIPKTVLADKLIGDTCEVVAIKDTSSAFLQYLDALSIDIGSKITIDDIVAFDNTFVIRINETTRNVSEKFANSIVVKKISN